MQCVFSRKPPYKIHEDLWDSSGKGNGKNKVNFEWGRVRLDFTQKSDCGGSMLLLQRVIFVIFFFLVPFPSCPVNPHVICMGVYGRYTLHDRTPQVPPRAPQGLPNAPPADPGRTQDIAFRKWDPVMIYATFHAPETSFGPHFNTFLAWVKTRGHRASYEMYDVHDVHDLDRVRARSRAPTVHKKFIYLFFFFSKFRSVSAVQQAKGCS
jgi:hypothetical protein